MTVIAEERHYRRGLVLGLTISELMLLLLFLLLLLLSYLMRDQEKRSEAKMEELTAQILILQDRNQGLKDERELVFERLVELRQELDASLEENSNIKDDFDELVKSNKVLEGIIEDNSSLTEIADLTEKADQAESLQDENEALQNALTEKQAELNEAVERATQALVDSMYDSRKELISDVVEELQSAGINNSSPDYEDGVLRLPQDVLFDSGDGELSATGEEAVDLLADALAKWVPCYTSHWTWACEDQTFRQEGAKLSAVFIEGHTDNKPVVNMETVEKYGDNWGLSSARAISAFKRLVSREPGASDKPALRQLTNDEGEKLLSISGYADNRPADTNNTSEGREKNRRIDVRFIFTPDIDGIRKEFSTGVSGVVPAIVPGDNSKAQ